MKRLIAYEIQLEREEKVCIEYLVLTFIEQSETNQN